MKVHRLAAAVAAVVMVSSQSTEWQGFGGFIFNLHTTIYHIVYIWLFLLYSTYYIYIYIVLYYKYVVVWFSYISWQEMFDYRYVFGISILYIYIDLNLEPSLYLWGFLSILCLQWSVIVSCIQCTDEDILKVSNLEETPNQTIWFVDNLGLAIRQVNGNTSSKQNLLLLGDERWRVIAGSFCWNVTLTM